MVVAQERHIHRPVSETETAHPPLCQSDSQTDRQTHRHTDTQAHRHTDTHTEREREREREKEREREPVREVIARGRELAYLLRPIHM